MTDEIASDFLELAIREAKQAKERGDYGIGAVLVFENKVIARSGNEVLTRGLKPWAHAEMLALRLIEGTEFDTAANYRRMTIYTTLAPCPQCWGALLVRGVGTIVIGAGDPPAEPDYHMIPEVFKPNAPIIKRAHGAQRDLCASLFLETKAKLDQQLGL